MSRTKISMAFPGLSAASAAFARASGSPHGGDVAVATGGSYTTPPANVDGDAAIASSATTAPDEWPTIAVGSVITSAIARTSSTS